MPDTLGGYDPFLFTTISGPQYLEYLQDINAQIPEAQEASTMTLATGLEYFFLDELSGWAVWEITQDAGLGGSDNYPRGLFNGTNLPLITLGDQRFRFKEPFVYNQQVFPRPPYPWDHIFKVGAHFEPSDVWEFNVSWTRNTYEFAGQVDENMNHVGFEVGFHPLERWSVLGKYVLSHSVSLPRVDATAATDIEYDRHHSLYLRTMYRISEASEFACEFGVGGFLAPSMIFSTNPYGQYFPSLDTQMIVRVAYTAKF